MDNSRTYGTRESQKIERSEPLQMFQDLSEKWITDFENDFFPFF